MQDNHSLDEMRKRIQESLIQAKREQLRDKFGMLFDPMGNRLSLEGELDAILSGAICPRHEQFFIRVSLVYNRVDDK